MSCKDCLHYEVCVIVEHSVTTDEDYLTEFGCDDFKDRTKWVEQKHGRWRKCTRWSCGIKKDDGFTAGCCGRWVKERTIYCPNCGAKMDEPKEIPWAGKTSGLTSLESNVGSKFDHASEGAGATCAENGLVMAENDKTIYDRMKEIAFDDPKWLESVDHLKAINAILYGLP